jgi:putative transposase
MRSQVIKLDPTCTQVEFFRHCVGTARFAFNWALKRWRDQFAGGQTPHEGKLRKELNAVTEREFPWMLEVPKAVVQHAIKKPRCRVPELLRLAQRQAEGAEDGRA